MGKGVMFRSALSRQALCDLLTPQAEQLYFGQTEAIRFQPKCFWSSHSWNQYTVFIKKLLQEFSVLFNRMFTLTFSTSNNWLNRLASEDFNGLIFWICRMRLNQCISAHTFPKVANFSEALKAELCPTVWVTVHGQSMQSGDDSWQQYTTVCRDTVGPKALVIDFIFTLFLTLSILGTPTWLVISSMVAFIMKILFRYWNTILNGATQVICYHGFPGGFLTTPLPSPPTLWVPCSSDFVPSLLMLLNNLFIKV